MTDKQERIKPLIHFHICVWCKAMWERDPGVHPGICPKCNAKTWNVYTEPVNAWKLEQEHEQS